MRYIVILLAAAALLSGCATFIPTPDMAMSWNPSADTRKWQPQFVDGNPSGFIMELVPAGQLINDWKEMVSQQTVFTPATLSEYVSTWKGMLKSTDPNAKLKETKNRDGSRTVVYSSLKANELGIRRFIKASDGIYMIAYHVRPQYKNATTTSTWNKIIAQAQLVPNPQR